MNAFSWKIQEKCEKNKRFFFLKTVSNYRYYSAKNTKCKEERANIFHFGNISIFYR